MNIFRASFAMIITTVIIAFSVSASAETRATAAASEKPDLLSTFMCEKFSGSLGDLKLKLVESCNVEKPFSSSMTRNLAGDEIYLLCCHKAK